ncbi:alpha/beta fold hydrolase [Helicobacter marmotae]|uniref:alpha/beta fold hydrolase n=1 Tax=Helicobacter marmotae TaxID=152490 RepID=UPI0018F7EF62|nr:alpha/beta fold hydrolase [Helicobacter marmotae]
MQEITIYKDECFHSSKDNVPIYYDVYMPQNLDDVCIVQIAHGMVEHKGRYEWVGRSLAKAGFLVVINDHRGHGKSIDRAHEWGEMGGDTKISGFEYAVADMYSLTCTLKERYKPTFYVLLGHSMGSLLSRAYIKQYPYELNALILSGSPAYNRLVIVGELLAKGLYVCGLKQWGKHFINRLSFGSFNNAFLEYKDEDCSKGGFAWLCSDKQVVAAYKADKACSFVFSLKSFIGLFRGMRFVNDTKGLRGMHLPLLIISGSDDSCGDFGKGVSKIAKSYENCGFKVSLKLYAGLRHEILNEPNKAEVLNDMVRFIQASRVKGV